NGPRPVNFRMPSCSTAGDICSRIRSALGSTRPTPRPASQPAPRMATARQHELPLDGGASFAPPALTPDTNLSEQCGQRPRLGALKRCKPCLKASTDADRQSRAEAEAKVEAERQPSNPATTKVCIACKIEKPLHAFAQHHRATDGKRKSCRACVRAG